MTLKVLCDCPPPPPACSAAWKAREGCSHLPGPRAGVGSRSLGKHSLGPTPPYQTSLAPRTSPTQLISSSHSCRRLRAEIRDGTGFELQTKPTKALSLRFMMPWAVFSGRSYGKRKLTFTEGSLGFSLCAGGFIYIISFNPHKQPRGFNAAKPDT